jgi:AraC-like DNA-binding protein
MNIKTRGSIIILVLFLTCIQSFVIAQKQEDIKKALIAKIDSCNNNLLKLNETEISKMDILTITSGEYTLLADFYRGKKRYGNGHYALMRKYLVTNNLDSIYFHYKEASNYCLQENNPEDNGLATRIHLSFIAWCISNNYFELATKIINQYMQYNSQRDLKSYGIYTSLLLLYQKLGKDEQAIETGQMALAISPQEDIMEGFMSHNYWRSVIYSSLKESYFALNDFEKCIAVADSSIHYMPPQTEDINLQFEMYHAALAEAYFYKAASYSYMRDFKQAKLSLEKMENPYQIVITSKKFKRSFPETATIDFKTKYNWAYMIYYFQTGNYTKAIEFLNENKKLLVTPSLSPDAQNFLKWEAIMLEKMGKYPETIQVLKEQQHYTDSINRVNTAKEVSSLWAIFEVDKVQQEKEQSEFKVKVITGVTIGIILTAIGIISYFIVTTNKLKKKNRVLFKQQKDILSSIPNTIYKHKETASEKDLRISDNKTTTDNPEQIRYMQIIEYLKTTKQYTDPDLSREQVAKELGTNRQYIIDAISSNANMSFNEFINTFRIDYARDLLLSDPNMTIRKIYMDAGFKSHNTFSILFKDKFGMTPSEFRNCAKEDALVE